MMTDRLTPAESKLFMNKGILPERFQKQKAVKIPRMKSKGEETLALLIKAHHLPEPIREHRFHPERNFRFDFAWPSLMLAVEVEGGTWMKKGGHNSGAGVARDIEKYDIAASLGWLVLRFITKQAVDGTAVFRIKEEIDKRGLKL